MEGAGTAGESFRLIDGESVVTVGKLFTRTGERLELHAETLDESVRLDAIVLESVAWQDVDEMSNRAETVDRSGARSMPAPLDREREEPITISSEFAQARVSKASTDEGERLHIEAPKLGYEIRLDPHELEWLTLQDYETFSAWLEHPFGPEGEDHDHQHDQDHNNSD